ncbi:MAG TPA: 3-hydroxyacyl-CoA dehydrogenase NAD-binding domain-containing protein [Xanthobacteraceae bacterium]|jgi:3-hydroxyacyl-CoA dehydrogenase|nr:3-hydroxyacyl-CoA dehydrogenase NAD-binding domain-containing protein [Xanthobacteraceae bacterium]
MVAMLSEVEESPVRVERAGRIAVIVIDNPPVNANSWEVRRGLLAAIRQVGSDDSSAAAVLIGAGRNFMAGADIREFDGPLREPQTPELIAAIEACAKPIVAAIAGAALGGGFELALGCDARVAAVDAVVGLPEVTLGVIPGAGGTQRLPRLVGVAKAIELIASARRVKAGEALQLGLVDLVVADDLRTAAIRHAEGLGQAKRRLRDDPLPADSADAIERAEQAALRRARGNRAVAEAVAAVRRSMTAPFATALAEERAAFERLRVGEDAAALRHLFFAEREAARVPGLESVSPRPVARVGVIGAGTMGSGIAVCLLDAGFPVGLVERDEPSLADGLARVRADYRGAVESGRLTAEESERRLARLSPAVALSSLADADLVIEAVFEDLDLKQSVLRALSGVLKPGAILASNTSYLDLDALADASGRPGDVIGLHFFSPARVMRLLEVVRGAATAPDVLATGLWLARCLGKLPVVARVGEGFIGNRIYSAYRTQCEMMLEEGAYPEDVDRALVAFGFAMGPFAVGDLSGLDIAWRTRQRLAASGGARTRQPDILDRLCRAGRLGRKSGAGWYRYAPGAREGTPDPQVRAIIEEASTERGIVRRPFTAEEIQSRALAAMVNEAALLLGEGIAARASDIDLVLVNGYGFPPYEGGPLFWAGRQPRARLLASIDAVARAAGPGFRRGDLAFLDRIPERP